MSQPYKIVIRDLTDAQLKKAKDVKNYIYKIETGNFIKRKVGDPRESTDLLEWDAYIIKDGKYKISPITGWYVRNKPSNIKFEGVTDEERLIIVEKHVIINNNTIKKWPIVITE